MRAASKNRGNRAMPSVAVQPFSDPYEYQAFTCDAQHRVVVTGCGSYEAKTIRLDLHRVLMRRAWQALPAVSHLSIPTGRSAVCFPLNAHETSWSWGGAELQAGEMFVVHSGGDFHSRADKGGQWASVSMASDVLATYVQAHTGGDLGLADVTRVRPRSEAMSRLLAVHQAAGNLAENAPDIVTRPEVAKVIEDELMHAVVDCLTAPAMLTVRRSHRQPVMRRFEEFLEANPDQSLHILDVCSAIGVSERTLRLHCLEHLG